MKQIYVTLIVLAVMAGCQAPPKLEVSKAEAQKRFFRTRAQLIYGVAAEHLKSGQLDKAADKAHEALALDATFPQARTLLGKVYIEQGEYAAAIKELQTVCDQQPAAAEPLYLLAVAQERNGQLPAALENYRKAQALSPGNFDSVKAAAEVLVLMRRTPEAKLYVENYMSSAGGDVGMYELAGRLAMMTGDYAKASRYYQHAHSLDMPNVRYREVLAQAQMLNQEYTDAAEALSDLLADKKYKPSASILCLQGECYLRLNKAAQAQDAFYKATELAADAPDAWVGLAKSALASGDPARAVLSARKALELEPANGEALSLLGYGLLREGQAQEALDILQTGIKRNDKDSTLQCILGRAYAACGQANQAAQCYQEALRLDPQNPLAKELAGPAAQQGRIEK